MKHCLASIVPAIVLWASLVSSAQAAVWQGLEVTVESKWPGCGYGGYFPVAVHVINRGNPAVLRFDCSSEGSDTPMSVMRTVQVDTGRMSFHLLVPCVGYTTYMTMRVAVDGQPVNALTQPVHLPSYRGTNERGPATLLISDLDTDWGTFQAALESIIVTAAPTSGYSYSTPTATEDHQFIAPTQLPREWQAYTGLDLIAVPEAAWNRVPAETRASILKWVDSGGNLLMFSLGNVSDGNAIPPEISRLAIPLGMTAAEEARDSWSLHERGGDGRFFQRPKGLGRVIAVPNDPFRQFSQAQWGAVFQVLSPQRWEWYRRNGYSARHPSDDFLEFLVPSVRGVPVMAFLVLITLFAIVIGPVNYLYLWKKRRLYLLVLTIPLIAAVTSASLFAYSAVAHGFATRSRIRSLTILDQTKNSLMQTSRVSLYSGLAPSDGLRFSRESFIEPVWSHDSGVESGRVDWTETQHFSSGWLRSRTRTQFVITTHRDERGRLDIESHPNAINVANGLEWKLAALLVFDEQGGRFFGENLAAGDAATLSPATEDQLVRIAAIIARNAPQVPPQMTGRSGFSIGYSYYDNLGTSFKTSLVEQQFNELARSAGFEKYDRKRCYIAILEDAPEIDLGLKETSDEVPLHALIGYY